MIDMKHRLRSMELVTCAEAAAHIEDQERRIAELESQIAAQAMQEPQGDEYAYIDACNLAKDIHAHHYSEDSPHWRVLPDIRGALSQISNTVAGMSRRRTDPPAPANAIDAERYRFLRITTQAIRDDDGNNRTAVTPDEFDGYVDAAMKAAK